MYFITSKGTRLVSHRKLAQVIIDHVPAERYMRYLATTAVVAGIVIANGFVDTAVNDFTRRPDTVTSRGSFIDFSIDQWVESGGVGMGLGTFRAETARIVHNTAVWLPCRPSSHGKSRCLQQGQSTLSRSASSFI